MPNLKNLIELREQMKNQRHPGWLLVQSAIESSDCPRFIAGVARAISDAAGEDYDEQEAWKSYVLQLNRRRGSPTSYSLYWRNNE